MKKILIIITTEFVNYGGLTTVMMNYYKAINKNELQIDFASTNIPDELDLSFKYIKDNGSNYYCLGNRKKNIFKYLCKLKEILKCNNYDVIHINGNSSTMLFELFLAKIYKIKIRIAHGHTTHSNYPIIHVILKNMLKLCYTHAIAVSEKSGKWLFGKNFTILNNAIDVEKYKFNMKIRKEIRKKQKWDNYTIIGNVGKLYEPKNHKFLIEIFFNYHLKNKMSKLVLVGDGPLKNKIKNLIKEKNLEKDVIFLGMINNVQDIIQGFDIFVFPSLYEGLGLALIEAQASGLPCIASNTIPLETKVTDSIYYYSLNNSAEDWANVICNVDITGREESAIKAQLSIKNFGYDIKLEAQKLEEIYRS